MKLVNAESGQQEEYIKVSPNNELYTTGGNEFPPPSSNVGKITHTGSAGSVAIPAGSTLLVIAGATSASDILFGATQAIAESVVAGEGVPILAGAGIQTFRVPPGSMFLGFIGTNTETQQYYWS